ncbi:SspB family protein [Lacibacterium aquatile]|uniref:SspB family protein n=1 Tax=Lacibacterium aquatile TaxID=1168082 RepID=A0ABW5DR89_9PROT
MLRYDQMIEEALRGVVRRTLRMVAATGLPGNHHFYVTFRTDAEGVIVPDHLRAKYPEEMTIVIQHQFWGLEVTTDMFTITLSFNDVHEKLVIPFPAITAFADPAAQFGLQFQQETEAGEDGNEDDEEEGEMLELEEGASEPTPLPAAKKSDKPGDDKPAGSGDVVFLDQFRRK